MGRFPLIMTNCRFVCAESQGFRIAFLVVGMVLLLVAPIVSDWVPFYYSSAMTLGIFLVIIVLLYQVRSQRPPLTRNRTFRCVT
jgi:hypothetical protein